MNSTNQEFQIPSLESLSLGGQFHIPSLNFPNSSENSSSPSLSALASEHLTQNSQSSNLLNFDLSVGSKCEEKTLSLADIANLHLSSTGDFFKQWNEITPQTHIRKFEELMA